jgi:hypothetical protein
VTRWRTLGENVGMGETVSSLHRAFMHSRAHRKNIPVVFEGERDPGTKLPPPPCRP